MPLRLLALCILLTQLYAADHSTQHSLCLAIEQDDLPQIQLLLRNRPDLIHRPDSSGRFPLHWAQAKTNLELIGRLIRAGADPYTPTPEGQSLVDLAAADVELAKAIAQGGGPSASTSVGRFDWAGHRAGSLLELDELVTEKGKRVLDRSDRNGWTPLMHAIKLGDRELVMYLLKHQVRTRVVDRSRRSMMHYAARLGDPKIIDALAKQNCPIDTPDSRYKTPLMEAAQYGRLQAVTRLLAHGARVIPESTRVTHPLALAISSGNGPLIELFLQSGASALEGGRQPPLAVAAGHIAGAHLLPILLDSIPLSQRQQLTQLPGHPLHEAARRGRLDTVDLLLKSGASPVGRDRRGQTIWHLATRLPDATLLSRLLEGSRDGIDVPDSDGWTAVDIANEIGFTDRAKQLAQAGCPQTVPAEIFTLLPAMRTGDSSGLLQLCSQQPQHATVALRRRSSLLHEAVAYGLADAIPVLLKLGLSWERSDRAGQTALFSLARTPQSRITSTVEQIIASGCNLNQLDKRDRTVLDYSSKKPTLKRLLLQQGARSGAAIMAEMVADSYGADGF